MPPRACRRRPSSGCRTGSSGQAVHAHVAAVRRARARRRRRCAGCAPSSLEDHKVPQRVFVHEALPRTARGKVDRQALIAAGTAEPAPVGALGGPLQGRAAASTKLAADAGDVRVARAHPRRLVRSSGRRCSRSAARRRWSWLAPAVGLAVLTAVAWGTVRLPGRGRRLGGRDRRPGGWRSLACRVPVARDRVAAGRAGARRWPWARRVALAASIPFLVEGRFGILGTGLNPDMSQHLFAADRLAHGEGGRLLSQGYPLGPHALVVAVVDADRGEPGARRSTG